ncbi:MAG: beta-ketoacyl synthase N-terminal-like domain-containing protein [Candidatus Omnitrophota bacterium]
MIKQKNIVITGLGILSPLGKGINEFWRNFSRKQLPLRRINLFSTKEFPVKYAFQLNAFSFQHYFKNIKSAYIPRSTQMVLVSAQMALKDAGYEKGLYREQETGVMTATVYGSGKAAADFCKKILLDGPDAVDPLAFPASIINFTSNYLAKLYAFRGPNISFSSGASAGIEAMISAATLIDGKNIKAALINGLNDLCLINYVQLNRKKLLYAVKGKKAYQQGIFSLKRNGFILGENATTLIIENEILARRRNAPIYARICGFSLGFGKNKQNYIRIIQEALDNAQISPSEIDICLLNANGISNMDKAEYLALEKIFSKKNAALDCVAVKENNGECEAASGVLQALIAAKYFYHNKIIASAISYQGERKSPKLQLLNSAKRKEIRYVLINSFDFNGNNACLVLGRAGQN